MSDIPGGAEGAGTPDPNTTEQQPDGGEPLLDEDLSPEEEEFDEEPAEPEAGDEPAAVPVPRAQNRIRALQERAARAERERDELRGYRQAMEQLPRQPAADAGAQQRQQMEALRQRWEQMNPVDVAFEAMQLGAQQQQQSNFFIQKQIEDRIDKQAYEAEARSSAQHARYRDRVEQIVAEQRRQGNYAITRTDVFYRLLGEDVANRAARAAPGQRRQAASRVQGQQTRPTGARGDAGTGTRRPAPGSPEDDDRIIEEGLRAGLTF